MKNSVRLWTTLEVSVTVSICTVKFVAIPLGLVFRQHHFWKATDSFCSIRLFITFKISVKMSSLILELIHFCLKTFYRVSRSFTNKTVEIKLLAHEFLLFGWQKSILIQNWPLVTSIDLGRPPTLSSFYYPSYPHLPVDLQECFAAIQIIKAIKTNFASNDHRSRIWPYPSYK